MLKDVIFPQHRRYKSRTEWEPVGFFSEALCNATQFDIKLGFFSSTAINILSDGFAAFLYNGGRMRMVINDILSMDDKQAIMAGKSDVTIPYFDLQNLQVIKDTLSERDRHFFECLAWLIRNERLELKIVVPKDGEGIAHSKCGLFTDGLNRIAFDGSCNFSRTALISNIENITVFCDWDGKSDVFRIDDINEDFERTFSGQDNSLNYLKAEEVKDSIAQNFYQKEIGDLLNEEIELIIKRQISDFPKSIQVCLNRAKKKVASLIEELNEHPIMLPINEEEPRFPFDKPRDYQKQAYENWKANGQKGLFAMATGTGKTLTSLNCLLEIYKRNRYYKAIILVPTITLVNQWEKECRKFNFGNIIKVYSKNAEWRSKIELLLMAEKYRKFNEPTQNFIIISTYASFAREKVFSVLNSFERSKVLFIADEAHNMGSPSILKRIGTINYLRRIGLSATPERQFDEDTNNKLYRFFGAEEKFTFEYSMKEAIQKGVLCKYYYYPHLVKLTDEEMVNYVELSEKISKYFNYSSCEFENKDEILMGLLLARKRIVHKAINKIDTFKKIIEERYEKNGNLKYSLIYVPEGNKPDYFPEVDLFDKTEQVADDVVSDHLIDIYTEVVMRVDKYITVRKFVSGQKDRDEILADFARGKLQVLTSMKCLDEGVDVPRSEFAIFCASTGNPRQFIQRRGRVLRKHPDKYMAEIHDLVVAPEVSATSASYKMEQSLLKGELMRVKDFSMLSENPSYSQMELKTVMEHYGLNMYNNNHIV